MISYTFSCNCTNFALLACTVVTCVRFISMHIALFSVIDEVLFSWWCCFFLFAVSHVEGKVDAF